MVPVLSEKELKVLLHIEHEDGDENPPKGMSKAGYATACDGLKARGFANPGYIEGHEVETVHILPAGVSFLEDWREEEVRKNEEKKRVMEEEKKMEAIITDDELNMLFNEVLKKHPYFKNIGWSPTYWDKTKGYLKRLFFIEQSPMAAYKLANEMSIDSTRSYHWDGYGVVNEGNRDAYRLYVVIYYKFKDNPSCSIMLDALAPQMGKLGSKGKLEEIQKILDKVKVKCRVWKKTDLTEIAQAEREELEMLRAENKELKEKDRYDTFLREKEDKLIAELDAMNENSPEYLKSRIKALEGELEEAQKEIEQLKKELSEANEPFEIPRQKIRIELLNFIFAQLKYDTEWMIKNRKVSAVARLYAAIIGHNRPNNLTSDVGKVTYKVRPQELDAEIGEVNKLLQAINTDWKIQL